MGKYFTSTGDQLIENEDVGVLAATLGMEADAIIICSYSLTAVQILDGLKKNFNHVYIGSPTLQITYDEENRDIYINGFRFRELSFSLIESQKDHFAGVIIHVCFIWNNESAEEREVRLHTVSRIVVYLKSHVKIDNCVISKITIPQEKRQRPFEDVGFYFENADLLNAFRCSVELKYPYETTLTSDIIKTPNWYENRKGSTLNGNNYTYGNSGNNSSSASGCYIATAVYGSYDCPEVWTLRRFRDYILAQSWYGRNFIKLYYAISPTLVHWFGETKWFKAFWKSKLDQLVLRLKLHGIKDDPYSD